LSYVAIFTEPKNPVTMGQLFSALRDRHWRRAWSLCPRWLIAIALTGVALIATMLLLQRQKLGIEAATVTSGFLVTAFLFTLRNLGIVLWFNFLPGAQRGDLAAIVVIVVLSGIVPFIFAGAGAGGLMSLVSPWASQADGLAVAIPAAVETLVVYFFAVRAWRAGEKLRLQSS